MSALSMPSPMQMPFAFCGAMRPELRPVAKTLLWASNWHKQPNPAPRIVLGAFQWPQRGNPMDEVQKEQRRQRVDISNLVVRIEDMERRIENLYTGWEQLMQIFRKVEKMVDAQLPEG